MVEDFNTRPKPALREQKALLDLIDRLPKGLTLRLRHHSTPHVPHGTFPTLVANQGDLATISPRDFEALVADLLRADGFDPVQLVARENAPGPDVIAVASGPTGDSQQFLVECKAWKGAAGIDVIRGLMYRVDTEYRATGGIVAIASRFTSAAKEEAAKYHRWRLSLRDGEAITRWINEHARSVSARWVQRVDPRTEGSGVISLIENGHFPQSLRVGPEHASIAGERWFAAG